jgi:uncharacterized membrane protein
MGALIAATYPDEHRAAEVRAALHRHLAGGPPAPEETAALVRRPDGKVILHQSQALAAVEGPRHDLWMALVALLSRALHGSARSTVSQDAALYRLAALGVDPVFAARLWRGLPPASSAICVVVDDAALRGVLRFLRCYGGTILPTVLTG